MTPRAVAAMQWDGAENMALLFENSDLKAFKRQKDEGQKNVSCFL